MYTRCSHCHIAFEVSPEALARGRGRLRCPDCGLDFDALEHLSRKAPADLAAPPPVAPPQGTLDLAQPEAPEPAPPRTDVLVDVLAAHADFIEPLDAVDDAGPASATDAPGDQAAPAETGTSVDPDQDATDTPHHKDPSPERASPSSGAAQAVLPDPAEIARDAIAPFHPVLSAPTPSFIPDTAPAIPVEAPAQRQWPRWLAVAALLVLLAGQSIHAERDHLAADARWRPWLERACASLGCALPAWHDPSAMRLMTRDVRPHPSVPDALLISASFRNDAPWAQHWPRLHLSLSDLNGQTIAQREFAPDQYLGMAARDLTIQPGQTASVALEVRDPGKQAVAFEFDFR